MSESFPFVREKHTCGKRKNMRFFRWKEQSAQVKNTFQWRSAITLGFFLSFFMIFSLVLICYRCWFIHFTMENNLWRKNCKKKQTSEANELCSNSKCTMKHPVRIWNTKNSINMNKNKRTPSHLWIHGPPVTYGIKNVPSIEQPWVHAIFQKIDEQTPFKNFAAHLWLLCFNFPPRSLCMGHVPLRFMKKEKTLCEK